MTSIRNFPEELLLNVFSYLTNRDLNKCLYVCHSWYIPARIRLLKELHFHNINRIRRFITAFNQNPDPRFLAAVKGIDISSTKDLALNDKDFRDLFFRFPNLEKVALNSILLDKFNDDLCREFLKHSPKLTDVTVKETGYYRSLTNAQLYKARLLLTELEVRHDEVENPKQFVTDFPRIKTLTGPYRENNKILDTFESLLPVFMQASNLTKIRIMYLDDDTDRFMEEFLQTKTLEEQKQLVERISRVNDLSVRGSKFLSTSVIKFITEYMTGLKYFEASGKLTDEMGACHTMFDLIQSINHCKFDWSVHIDRHWVNLVEFMQQVCQHSSQERILCLRVFHLDRCEPQVWVDTNEHTRSLTIQFAEQELSNRRSLFDSVLDMDTFEMQFTRQKTKPYMDVYDSFFRTKSTVKKVILHLTDTLIGGEKPLDEDVSQNHIFVEELSILSTAHSSMQKLLDRCCIAFPNLKLLTFDRFHGVWQDDLSKLQLDLPKFTLERLVIGLPFPRYKNRGKLSVVIEVDLLSLGDKYFYKVPFDGSKPTRIDGQDLQDDEGGQHYSVLHVVIGNLKCLELVSPVKITIDIK